MRNRDGSERVSSLRTRMHASTFFSVAAERQW